MASNCRWLHHWLPTICPNHVDVQRISVRWCHFSLVQHWSECFLRNWWSSPALNVRNRKKIKISFGLMQWRDLPLINCFDVRKSSRRALARWPQLTLSIVIAFSHLCDCSTPTNRIDRNWSVMMFLTANWMYVGQYQDCNGRSKCKNRHDYTMYLDPIDHWSQLFVWRGSGCTTCGQKIVFISQINLIKRNSTDQAMKSVEFQYSAFASHSPSDQNTSGSKLTINSFISFRSCKFNRWDMNHSINIAATNQPKQINKPCP